MKANEVLAKSSEWLFVAPVTGLQLTSAVNFEHRIDRVTFVAASHLPRRRRRFGFNRKISDLIKAYAPVLERFFSEAKTFATFRLTGTGTDLQNKFLTATREELAIVALSQLGYGRRRHNANPMVAKETRHGLLSYLMLDARESAWSQPNRIKGKIGSLRLDERWKKFQEDSFYFDLVRMIRKDTEIASSWRRDIRNASILAGQSQVSVDLSQAFLWNMIALELLLVEQQDRCIEALPSRAEAFIGWAADWQSENYPDLIRKLYKKRNDLVHRGRRDQVEVEDVLRTDDILLNVLNNITKHQKLFSSKDKLIEFSKKVEAERLLGVNAHVRPKTLTFVRLHYREQDYREI